MSVSSSHAEIMDSLYRWYSTNGVTPNVEKELVNMASLAAMAAHTFEWGPRTARMVTDVTFAAFQLGRRHPLPEFRWKVAKDHVRERSK